MKKLLFFLFFIVFLIPNVQAQTWYSSAFKKSSEYYLDTSNGVFGSGNTFFTNISWRDGMNDDFSDLDWTLLDNTTSLDFAIIGNHMEQGSWSLVYFNLTNQELNDTNNLTVRAWWNNTNTGFSNPNSVFHFYDDFEDGDCSDWALYGINNPFRRAVSNNAIDGTYSCFFGVTAGNVGGSDGALSNPLSENLTSDITYLMGVDIFMNDSTLDNSVEFQSANNLVTSSGIDGYWQNQQGSGNDRRRTGYIENGGSFNITTFEGGINPNVEYNLMNYYNESENTGYHLVNFELNDLAQQTIDYTDNNLMNFHIAGGETVMLFDNAFMTKTDSNLFDINIYSSNTIDTFEGSANTTSIDLINPSNNTIHDTIPDFEFFVNDSYLNNTINASLIINNTIEDYNESVFNATLTTLKPDSLSDGYYNWRIYANGSENNQSSTRFFTLDTTKPIIEFINPTPSNDTSTINNYTFINVSVNESNLDTVTLDWNGTNETITCNIENICEVNKTSLNYGTYIYKVYASDIANNYNVSETRYITITSNPPVISDHNVYWNNSHLVGEADISDPDSNIDTITYTWWLNNSFLSNNQNITGINSSGNYTQQIYVNDTSGEEAYSNESKFLDIFPPIIANHVVRFNATTLFENANVSNDVGIDTIEYYWWKNNVLVSTNQNYTLTDSDNATYTSMINATDLGNLSTLSNDTFEVKLYNPVFNQHSISDNGTHFVSTYNITSPQNTGVLFVDYWYVNDVNVENDTDFINNSYCETGSDCFVVHQIVAQDEFYNGLSSESNATLSISSFSGPIDETFTDLGSGISGLINSIALPLIVLLMGLYLVGSLVIIFRDAFEI